MGKLGGSILKVLAIAAFFIPVVGPLISIGLSIGGSMLDKRYAEKQAKKNKRTGWSGMVREPLANRRLVYGRTRVGGIWLYATTTDSNNYLHLVLGLCEGPIERISKVYFDDKEVTYDSNGDGTGDWANVLRVKEHLGGSAQTADTDLVAEVTEWTTNHRLRGIAYIYCRLKFDQNVYNNGIPQISAEVVGKNDILDFRDDTTGYTFNPALCLADYMSGPYGPGISINSDTDSTTWDAAANQCEEVITLPNSTYDTDTYSAGISNDDDTFGLVWTDGSLTPGQMFQLTSKGQAFPDGFTTGVNYYITDVSQLEINGGDVTQYCKASTTPDGAPVDLVNAGGAMGWTCYEHRFNFNGVIDLGDDPESIIQDFTAAMTGTVVYSGGLWFLTLLFRPTPEDTITESMLAGPIVYKTKRNKQSLVNKIKGSFKSPLNRYIDQEYTPYSVAADVTADGEEIIQGLDMPHVSTPTQAFRVAATQYLKGRTLQKSLQLTLNIEGLKLRAGSRVLVTLDRYNLSADYFDIDSWELGYDDGKPIVRVSLSESQNGYSETDLSNWGGQKIYDKDGLSDGVPQAPQNLTATSSDDSYGLVSELLQWDASPQDTVLNGGLAVVEWKKSADADYTGITGGGTSIEYPVRNLEPLTEYDFRVAFRTSSGMQSAWAEITNSVTQIDAINAIAEPLKDSERTVILDGVSSRVDVTDTSSHTFTDTTNDEPFTLACWVKVRNFSTIQPLIAKHDNAIGQEWRMWFAADGTLNASITDGTNECTIKSAMSFSGNTGEWMHIAGSYSGSGPSAASGEAFATAGNQLSLFVNATDITSTATVTNNASYAGMADTTCPVSIGYMTALGAATEYFGAIEFSRAQVYNYALNASQIDAAKKGEDYFADQNAGEVFTSGALAVGRRYRIRTFQAGDDFANTGAASNASGVVWVATASTPTTWANDSVLVRAGLVLDLRGGNAISEDSKIYDVSGKDNHGTLTDTDSGSPEQPEQSSTTWVPSFSFSGDSTGVVESVTGSYTRTGEMIYFSGRIELSNEGSASGTATVSGLPYTINKTDSNETAFNISQASGFTGLSSEVSAEGIQGTKTFELKQWGATGTASVTESETTNTTAFSFSGSYLGFFPANTYLVTDDGSRLLSSTGDKLIEYTADL